MATTNEPGSPATVTALRRPPVRQSTVVRSDMRHTFDTFVRTIGPASRPASQVESVTKAYPFIPLSQQLYWLGSRPGDPASPLVKAYQQTGQFLVGQGRLTAVPSVATIAAHVDPTFIKKALSGGC
jgi:hypothetical protein